MRYFRQVHAGLDTSAMLAEIAAASDLWDLYPERRTTPGGPHGEMQDIWVRARSRDDLVDPEAFRLPHWPVFYEAWHRLPAIQNVVWSLMGMSKAVQLGNVLITRIPAHGRIAPHIDTGWAPEWFTSKFYVVLDGGPACVNLCLDEAVSMLPGEIWSFENRVLHSVENHDTSERISLIVTLRVEP